MLAGSTPPSDSIKADDGRGHDAQRECRRLLARVTRALPTLDVRNARVEQTGGDHLLLIVDDRYAFRFPRAGRHGLALEIAVLKALAGRLRIATPSYDYVDPDGRFAGYRFIQGVALTPSRFAMLSPASADRLIEDAALFLRELHSLTHEAIASPETWSAIWTSALHAEYGIAERLPLIAARAPQFAGRVAAFYDRYRRDRTERRVIVHGDLVGEHLLLDPRRERLAGIIDFGDVALGDPAQDFLGFWSYGAEAAARAIELYDTGGEDPGLLGRSRNHFIRYSIEHLCERLAEGTRDGERREAAELDALLNDFEASH